MKSFLKNRFVISTTAFVLLMAALVVLIIYPAIREIQTINHQVMDERERLERLYVRGQLLKNVRNDFQSIQKDVGFLDEILLKENQELQYIAALERLADEFEVELKITVGDATVRPQQPYSELEFTFQITGYWPDMLAWVERVEALPYYTNVNAITITARQDEQATQQLATLAISAETYWLLK